MPGGPMPGGPMPGARPGMLALPGPGAQPGPPGPPREVQVPAELVGGLIGPGGSTINDLRAQAGPAVFIGVLPPATPGGPQTAKITGPEEATAHAESLIVNKLNELRAKRNPQPQTQGVVPPGVRPGVNQIPLGGTGMGTGPLGMVRPPTPPSMAPPGMAPPGTSPGLQRPPITPGPGTKPFVPLAGPPGGPPGLRPPGMCPQGSEASSLGLTSMGPRPTMMAPPPPAGTMPAPCGSMPAMAGDQGGQGYMSQAQDQGTARAKFSWEVDENVAAPTSKAPLPVPPPALAPPPTDNSNWGSNTGNNSWGANDDQSSFSWLSPQTGPSDGSAGGDWGTAPSWMNDSSSASNQWPDIQAPPPPTPPSAPPQRPVPPRAPTPWPDWGQGTGDHDWEQVDIDPSQL